MKPRYRFLFCLIVCFMSFLVSSVSLLIVTSEINNLSFKVEVLEKIVVNQNKTIAEQNETIEFYKQYVDDVARCIVDGEW